MERMGRNYLYCTGTVVNRGKVKVILFLHLKNERTKQKLINYYLLSLLAPALLNMYSWS